MQSPLLRRLFRRSAPRNDYTSVFETASTNVYTLAQGQKFRTEFGLKDQIQRSSVSVMSNIAEGCERTSRKEFLALLGYAKGSIGEVRSQL